MEYAQFVDIFDPVHRHDRWLLMTFSHYDEKYYKVLETMKSILSTKQAKRCPHMIQQVREELLKEETT
jgi:hypothetical protein